MGEIGTVWVDILAVTRGTKLLERNLLIVLSHQRAAILALRVIDLISDSQELTDKLGFRWRADIRLFLSSVLTP